MYMYIYIYIWHHAVINFTRMVYHTDGRPKFVPGSEIPSLANRGTKKSWPGSCGSEATRRSGVSNLFRERLRPGSVTFSKDILLEVFLAYRNQTFFSRIFTMIFVRLGQVFFLG